MREDTKTVRLREPTHALLRVYASVHGMSHDKAISQLLCGAMSRNRALANAMRLALAEEGSTP